MQSLPKLIASLILCGTLCACATFFYEPPVVAYGERSTMSFTGKGAAAGLMMDAFMGGAGVAIGIAIDEGIAKDIAANIERGHPGFSVLTIVKQQLKLQHLSASSLTKVTVETYGFRTVAGEGDKVSPWLVVKFTRNNKDIFIRYPQEAVAPEAAELSVVKTDAAVAFRLMNTAVEQVVTQFSVAK